MFGEWTHNIDSLHKEFVNSGSVKYVVINNFLSEEWANKLHDEFPLPESSDAPWKKIDNPTEIRFTLWNHKGIPSVDSTIHATYSDSFVKYMKDITGFEDLIVDPHSEYHTGLTAMPRNGKMGIHLDVHINMQSQVQRRCNLLIYLNKGWKEEYGGALQIGDSPSTCKDIVAPSWNTAIIMENSAISHHGIPRVVKCPEGEFRKNLVVYYSSLINQNTELRYKSKWFMSPEEVDTPKLRNIYEIRSTRPIKSEDLEDWTNWREETI